VFGVIVENFIENNLYEEAIGMYKELISNKNGADCDE